MLGYLAVLLAANVLVTGFARLPIAHSSGPHPSIAGRFGPGLEHAISQGLETPIPQDWVGLATQMIHQRVGGASYLFGERRMTGWWYYYLVALAVKVPLTFWIVFAGRAALRRGTRSNDHSELIPLAIAVFLVLTAIGSSRNYGLRYLLPLAPLAVVWVSALAEGGRWARTLACLGVIGQALAVGSIHPNELSYFNALAGGPIGGRHVLADSNLDWGQGLKSLARLQARHPEYRDLTLYYFGDTDPHLYGVIGRCHTIDAGIAHPGLPPTLSAETKYVAVSASLQWGPWGPPGYFRSLNDLVPVDMTDDATIAIYRLAQ
jgi:4-amino-4-deoxy-L-arabinose transferase-like glycosyltransferase